MELIINQEHRVFDDAPAHLAELLEREGSLDRRGIAVAINQQVIPRSEWSRTPLSPMDTILIITATPGG